VTDCAGSAAVVYIRFVCFSLHIACEIKTKLSECSRLQEVPTRLLMLQREKALSDQITLPELM
jgi:hypothetical protein